MRHGNTVEFRGKTVYVPFGWIGDTSEGDNASLTKFPFVIPLKVNAKVFESINLGPSLMPPSWNNDDLYTRFETFFWNLHSEFGEVISGPIKMGSGSQEAFCMVGADPKSSEATASCLLLKGTWSADFIGNKRDLDKFFAIIQKLN
jgi:hypothetical protein